MDGKPVVMIESDTVDYIVEKCGPAALAVYLKLTKYSVNSVASVSEYAISDELCMSRTTVKMAIARLEEFRLIIVEASKKPKQYRLSEHFREQLPDAVRLLESSSAIGQNLAHPVSHRPESGLSGDSIGQNLAHPVSHRPESGLSRKMNGGGPKFGQVAYPTGWSDAGKRWEQYRLGFGKPLNPVAYEAQLKEFAGAQATADEFGAVVDLAIARERDVLMGWMLEAVREDKVKTKTKSEINGMSLEDQVSYLLGER